MASFNFQNTETTFSYFLNFNRRFVHALPLIAHWSTNALLKVEQPHTNTIIKHQNHPLRRSKVYLENSNGQGPFYFHFLMIIGFSLIPTSAIVFIVKEKESGSKHQQYISGVSMLSYWVSNYAWDLIKYTVLTTGVLLTFYLSDLMLFLYTSEQQLHVTVLTFSVFGQQSFSLIYMLSYMFNNLQTAMIFVMSLFQLGGLVGQLGFSILSILNKTTSEESGELLVSDNTL